MHRHGMRRGQSVLDLTLPEPLIQQFKRRSECRLRFRASMLSFDTSSRAGFLTPSFNLFLRQTLLSCLVFITGESLACGRVTFNRGSKAH